MYARKKTTEKEN